VQRGLAFISLGLTLLGLELSTEVISLTFSRLSAGVNAISNGVEFHVTTLRFVAGVGALGTGIVLWLMLMWLAHERKSVGAVGQLCPECGSSSRRVKRKRKHRLLSSLMGRRLTRRHCDVCGWSGLSLGD